MRFLIKLVVFAVVASCLLEGWSLGRDHQKLTDDLIRLHVVAASDTAEDQQTKLQVRDAVVCFVDQAMKHVMTPQEAKTWIESNIPQIQQAANDVLDRLGSAYDAVVTFTREAFPKREYDSFSLPAGSINPCGSPWAREMDRTGGAWFFRVFACRQRGRIRKVLPPAPAFPKR